MITNDPHFTIRIDESAPGEETRLNDRTGKTENVPGWTVEIVWRAQELARVGLEFVLRESSALFACLGELHEQRVRRVDVCADVEGWELDARDLARLVKRPRAKWAEEWRDKKPTTAQDFGLGAMDGVG